MNTRQAAAAVAITIALLLAGGCLTPPPPLTPKDSVIKTAQAGGLRATARFLDDETLIAKFGRQTNPYLTDYTSVQLRRFMVFDLAVENTGSEPVKFLLNRLELHFEGKTLFPYNEFRINQFWEFKDEQKKVKGIDKARRERIVKDTLLPDGATIPPQGTLKRYAVFAGNTPSYGTATLYVPLLAASGQVVHRFEIPFEF